MKKLIFAALAIAAMAACTKSNVEFDQTDEIAFQPVSQKATKAAVTGNYYPIDDIYNFNVWAWWADKDANTDDNQISAFNTVYINDQTFDNRDFVNWGGLEKAYYWPTTGSLFFAGYSPANAPGSKGYLHGDKKFILTGYEQSTNIAQTTDLMWFHLTDVSYDRNTTAVPVQFHHALSWLSFRFNLEQPYTPTDWTVKSVKLTGIETKGNFSAEKTGTHAEQGTAVWSEWTETKEVPVYSSEAGYQVKYVTNDIDFSSGVQDPSILENTMNGVLVLPQSCAPTAAQVVIEFQQVAPSGTIVPQTKTLNLGGATDAWLPGKHYIYTITFGAEEILIAPTVVDWTKVDDLAVPVE
jgi:hypothetical protein